MALVIKIAGLVSGGESPVVYKDALVNEGSLLLHDYSNRGCLKDFSINHGSAFYDLASDVSKDKLGIDNGGVMNLPENPNIELTEGKGIRIEDIRLHATSSNPRGVNMGKDLLDYLYQENPNTLTIYWARASTQEGGGEILTSGSSSDRHIRMNTSVTGFQSSLAGGTSGSHSLTPELKLVQYAVEYDKGREFNRRFINGVGSSGLGTIPATGFTDDYSDLLLGVRSATPAENVTTTVVYRVMIVDLDKAGMSAEDIVKQDWEYCTGTGQYEGLPTKRPFIDVV